MMHPPTKSLGFVRVSALCSHTQVADPQANARAICEQISLHNDSQVLVFGELCLSGYTCGDLFGQDALLQASLEALATVAEATQGSHQLVVVGLPLRVDSTLYNTAAVLCNGRLIGIVPKQFLPNYQEFYEARWFSPAEGSEPDSIDLSNSGYPQWQSVPFGIDLLFRQGELLVGVEICEDLWMPVPPSSLQALSGANLLLNLSASNELIGKAAWRETLIRSQSGRCLAAYAYASNGPSESTTDVVLSGHCLIAENGAKLAESQRVGQPGIAWVDSTEATADIDLQRLSHERQVMTSWQQAVRRNQVSFRSIDCCPAVRSRDPSAQPPAYTTSDGSRRPLPAKPFVPQGEQALYERCEEIFGIQCAALAKRMKRFPDQLPMNIGISGGLDSTLALLVAVKTCEHQSWPSTRIHGITMPGFGTTTQTLQAARELMQLLDITIDEIDIRPLCLNMFQSLGHRPFGIDVQGIDLSQFTERLQELPDTHLHDLVFENVQARMRTMILMSRGFVLGTGDLSEQALGWSTYNGDHMSMYNVNTSIPKTLVRFLVRMVAQHEMPAEARQCLNQIIEQPITPELLPVTEAGRIGQLTEQTLGPYELHDFFLYHFVRFGTSPGKILHLAQLADFSENYSLETIRKTLSLFLRRFFANQFKRSCVPDGPKVGTVSLSPRGDWRMPSDAEVAMWLKELEA